MQEPSRRRQRPAFVLAGVLVIGLLGYVGATRGGGASPAREPADHFARGVCLGLFSQDPGFDYGSMLREIAGVGANWVSLNFSLQCETVQSETIEYPMGRDAQWAICEQAIDQAHRRGMRVLLFPITLLADATGPNEWRGRLDPPDRALWHANYRATLAALAEQAERWGVEALSIGSEFASLEGDRDEWLRTIAAVREVYSGLLVYSANWDHYEPVTFWDALDAIAISGYYELSRETDPSLETLVAAWGVVRGRIEAWRHASGLDGKPLVFSEIGYPSLDGGNMYPWDYTRKAPADAAEQALCYRAFIAAWSDSPALRGVFFYNWWHNIHDPAENSYSPRGRPAEAVMREWFATLRARDLAVPPAKAH
jgi:hypothetical protein